MAQHIDAAHERSKAGLRARRTGSERRRHIVRCMSCGGDRERTEACVHCGYVPGTGPGFNDEEGDF